MLHTYECHLTLRAPIFARSVLCGQETLRGDLDAFEQQHNAAIAQLSAELDAAKEEKKKLLEQVKAC